jgi:hypothetical protein
LALRPLLKFALVNRPEQTFPRFWSAYPKRVAKKDASKAWCELDPNEALIVEILTALEWQRELWVDLTYVPYPASWLRDERWTDEPPPQVNAMREQKRQQGSAWIQSIMRDREGKM